MTDADRQVPYRRQPVSFDPPVEYEHGPDSVTQPGVPTGHLQRFDVTNSVAYPGTVRTIQVYVPAQYSESQPASVMLFQDGQLYLDRNLDMRASIVFDNLIHAGEMPVTIGVFVDPGEPANRNAEYDPADSRYVDFLISEVIPLVRARIHLSDDPNHWAICGGSSGGNCAFTAAWHRPDHFAGY